MKAYWDHTETVRVKVQCANGDDHDVDVEVGINLIAPEVSEVSVLNVSQL